MAGVWPEGGKPVFYQVAAAWQSSRPGGCGEGRHRAECKTGALSARMPAAKAPAVGRAPCGKHLARSDSMLPCERGAAIIKRMKPR